ncbi:MAG: hypothetical protein KDB60_02290 [Propionibacteriaceae bacterium]|nr:hypothetical protein [Propionibacteriaceae bacterium]
MSIDDSDFDRLVTGRQSDDAAVSAFLDELRSAYPPGPTADIEAAHLAAMARESRVVVAARQSTGANVLSMRRTRFRRVLVSSVVGATVLLTAGVGAAAAMGINPIAQLVAPRIQQMPVNPTPVPPSVGTPPATDGGRPGKPTPAPSVPPVPVPTPTSTPTEPGTVESTTADSPKPTKTEKTKKPKKEKKPKKDKKDKSEKDAKKADETTDGTSTDR